MRRFVTLALVLLPAGSLSAQNRALTPAEAFEEADKQKDWRVDFDGVTLKEWEVLGAGVIKDGALILGGGAEARLQLKDSLRGPFKVLIECRYEGKLAPHAVWETHSFLSQGASGGSIPGKAEEWMELLYATKTTDGGPVAISDYYRHLSDKQAHSAGDMSGPGAARLRLEVPAGVTLSIRSIRVLGAPAADSSRGLFFALVGLFSFFLVLTLLSWFVRRRKPPNGPAPRGP